ncbi:MAG TPA: diaminopimelate decarboxylase, partial [Thermomicrobiales bacterium]|nr:diaminopimelate decarboxylase [Thermomicrobiales bacterium]
MLWPDTTSRTDSGILTIGGCALTDLAATFGTPLYIFDEATLVHRAEHVTAAFSGRYPNSHVAYGGKAYLGPAVIRIFARAGIGLDVVSGGELWAALKAGINPATIVMHGNNKPAAELRMALEQGVGLIVVDNAEEIA